MLNRNSALVALFLVQLLYGLNYTFAKVVMNGGFVKPFAFVFLRVAGATVLFWLLGLFFPSEKVAKKDYLTFFYAAIFGVAINMLLFLNGLEYTTPIHASAIITSTPIIILALSAIILKEKVTKLKVIGVILGFSGAIVLTIYGKSPRTADNILLGNTLIFLNTISYSLYIIIIKKLTAKYHPFTFIKWLFLFGLILITPFCYNEFNIIKWNTFTPYITFSVLFVIVGATFGTFLLNPLALSRLKASTVGIFIYLQPVIAGIFAIIMGIDSIDYVKIIAMLLIFSGVYLVSYKKKQKAIHE